MASSLRFRWILSWRESLFSSDCWYLTSRVTHQPGELRWYAADRIDRGAVLRFLARRSEWQGRVTALLTTLLVSARAEEVVQEDAMCNESVHMRGDIQIESCSILHSIIRCRRDLYLTPFESQWARPRRTTSPLSAPSRRWNAITVGHQSFKGAPAV